METKEAVRQGVVDYLSSRKDLSISSMQIDILSVDFRGNEAEATVSFRPKGGGEGMQIPYKLERKGDRWVVKARTGAGGGNPHGSMPMPESASGMGLPAGHPPISGKAPAQTKK
ncbi:MAG: hypothetical protein LLG20_08705 [Acidobacteriales bacterium]|nr:hypothetical protein [Terriglobales bacterium]